MHILNNYHSHNGSLRSPDYYVLLRLDGQLWRIGNYTFFATLRPQDFSSILDFPSKFDQCRERTFRYKGNTNTQSLFVDFDKVTSIKMRGIPLFAKGWTRVERKKKITRIIGTWQDCRGVWVTALALKLIVWRRQVSNARNSSNAIKYSIQSRNRPRCFRVSPARPLAPRAWTRNRPVRW